MSEHVTRYELEQLRDKMTVVTQQTVAASLSAWHDKMEQSVRNVERQVCLLISMHMTYAFYCMFLSYFCSVSTTIDCAAENRNDRP